MVLAVVAIFGKASDYVSVAHQPGWGVQNQAFPGGDHIGERPAFAAAKRKLRALGCRGPAYRGLTRTSIKNNR